MRERKNLLRKGPFLLALFLFQTCLSSIDPPGKPIGDQCELEKSVQKQGKCPHPFPDIESVRRKKHRIPSEFPIFVNYDIKKIIYDIF